MYDSSCLLKYTDDVNYMRVVGPGYGINHHTEEDVQKKKLALQQYREMYAHQEQLLSNGTDLDSLERAVGLLPNLRSLDYVHDNHRATLIIDQGSARPPVARSLASVVGCLLRGKATIRDLKIEVDNRIGNQILTLVNEIHRARLLGNDLVGWTRFLPNLTSLSLSVNANKEDYEAGESGLLGTYARLCEQATGLRSLTIFTRDYSWTEEADIGGKFFFIRYLSFPHLVSLTLHGDLHIEPTDLMRFFDRNGSTLRHLQFFQTGLYPGAGSWPEMFNHLRYALTALETIELDFLREKYSLGPNEEESLVFSPDRPHHLGVACRWILGKGDPTVEERKEFENMRAKWHVWGDSEEKSDSEVSGSEGSVSG